MDRKRWAVSNHEVQAIRSQVHDTHVAEKRKKLDVKLCLAGMKCGSNITRVTHSRTPLGPILPVH